MLRRKDQPSRADAVFDRIPLKEMVPRDYIILPRKQRKVAKARGTVIADLDVIGITVDRNRGPVRHVQRVFGGQKLAAIHEHPLTPAAARRDPPILGSRDKAVAHMENRPRRRKVDPAGHVVALDFDVIEDELAQLAIVAEIQQILKPRKGKILCPRRVIQRCVQRDLLCGDILGPHIDLAPHPVAGDQRPHRHIRDVHDIRQLARIRGRIACLRGHRYRVPIAIARRLKLAVADYPSRGIAGAFRRRRLHIDRAGNVDLAPTQIKRFMIRIIQQRLKRLTKCDLFIPERLDIMGQIEIPPQQQDRAGGHGYRPFKPCRRVKGHVTVQQIRPARDQHAAPLCTRIRRNKGSRIIRAAIPHRAIVPHVDLCQHVAQENAGHILDPHIINTNDTAVLPRQIQSKMPVDRRVAPDHIDPAAQPRPDNRADLDHFAIARKRHRRPHFDQPSHTGAIAKRRIPRDPHRG